MVCYVNLFFLPLVEEKIITQWSHGKFQNYWKSPWFAWSSKTLHHKELNYENNELKSLHILIYNYICNLYGPHQFHKSCFICLCVWNLIIYNVLCQLENLNILILTLVIKVQSGGGGIFYYNLTTYVCNILYKPIFSIFPCRINQCTYTFNDKNTSYNMYT